MIENINSRSVLDNIEKRASNPKMVVLEPKKVENTNVSIDRI